MRRIRSTGTGPELQLRKALFANGLRYRCNRRDLPGKPDITFTAARVVVFVHGCFWHQHTGCIRATIPRTNRDYWIPKLIRNTLRDKERKAELKRLGYQVVIVWECALKQNAKDQIAKIKRLVAMRKTKNVEHTVNACRQQFGGDKPVTSPAGRKMARLPARTLPVQTFS